MAWKIGILRMPSWRAFLVAFLILLNIGFWYRDVLFPWQPYSNVNVTSIVRSGDTIIFRANFDKDGCRFDRLVAVGILADATTILRWTDIDGLPDNYDRELGSQSLNIQIKLRGVQYDWIELRTRHYCGEDPEPVDRLFAVFHPPEPEE